MNGIVETYWVSQRQPIRVFRSLNEFWSACSIEWDSIHSKSLTLRIVFGCCPNTKACGITILEVGHQSCGLIYSSDCIDEVHYDQPFRKSHNAVVTYTCGISKCYRTAALVFSSHICPISSEFEECCSARVVHWIKASCGKAEWNYLIAHFTKLGQNHINAAQLLQSALNAWALHLRKTLVLFCFLWNGWKMVFLRYFCFLRLQQLVDIIDNVDNKKLSDWTTQDCSSALLDAIQEKNTHSVSGKMHPILSGVWMNM